MSPVDYTHVTVECSECDRHFLNSAAGVQQALRAAATTCKLQVLKEDLHNFRPQGITAYVLLSESHISIHTWPEEGFALVDVLSCSPLEIDSLINCLRQSLKAGSIELYTCYGKHSGQ